MRAGLLPRLGSTEIGGFCSAAEPGEDHHAQRDYYEGNIVRRVMSTTREHHAARDEYDGDGLGSLSARVGAESHFGFGLKGRQIRGRIGGKASLRPHPRHGATLIVLRLDWVAKLVMTHGQEE